MLNLGHIDWAAVAVIVAIVIAVFQGVRFLFGQSVNFGQILQRLTSVESDIRSIKRDISSNYKELNSGIASILKLLAEKKL